MSAAVSTSKANPRVRKDPKGRPTDGNQGRARFRGQDPNRHYVLVNAAAEDFGVGYYQDMGYEVELVRDDGPKAVHVGIRKAENGAAIMERGHVLMSCTKERQAEIEQFGPDGESGQNEVDAMERRMKLKGGNDPLRGMQTRGVSGSPFVAVKELTEEEELSLQ